MHDVQLNLQSLDTMWLAAAAAVLFFGALFGFLIGRAKARPVLGLLMGTVFTLLGLVAISLMPKKEPAYY